MKETINILCAADNKYVPYLGIMLTSVFENNTDMSVCAYVLIDAPLSARNKRRYNKLSAKYNQSIVFLMVNSSVFEGFPVKGADYWTNAIYYRLLVQHLLPIDVEKILYIDCDVVVTDSLKELWNTDLTGLAVGCVRDVLFNSGEIHARLRYSIKYDYFNSGVLLINLNYWRCNNIGQKCFDYLCENYDRLFANDQDILNALLYEKMRLLPVKYNYQIQFLYEDYFNNYLNGFKKIVMNVQSPVIIHFAFKVKPWDVLYFGLPFRKMWKQYKLKSPWRWMLPQMPKRKKINHLIKRYCLWPLGIMYGCPNYSFIAPPLI